jgi:hypothetical protein
MVDVSRRVAPRGTVYGPLVIYLKEVAGLEGICNGGWHMPTPVFKHEITLLKGKRREQSVAPPWLGASDRKPAV